LVHSCDSYFAPEGFKEPGKKTFSLGETFAAEIGHFAESLINGTRPVHSADEGRGVLEVVLKGAESPDDGRCVLPKNSK
jgi:predicted dehydrogenase